MEPQKTLSPDNEVRRRRLIGVLASIVVSGAGHFPLGRWRRGCVFLALSILVAPTVFLTPYGVFAALLLRLAQPIDILLLRPASRPPWSRIVVGWVVLFGV